MNKPKDCPFCGDTPTLVEMTAENGTPEFKVECINPGCALYQHLFWPYLWDRRPNEGKGF